MDMFLVIEYIGTVEMNCQKGVCGLMKCGADSIIKNGILTLPMGG